MVGRKSENRLTQPRLEAAGRRLWTTGGYTVDRVKAWSSSLTTEQAAWVMAGYEAAKNGDQQ